MGFTNIGGKSRAKAFQQQFLEYILVVTDGEETETNYLNGLKASFPEKVQRQVCIKVIDKIHTEDLVEEALKKQRYNPQFRETWIVFDRDDRSDDFDAIIAKAKRSGIQVGWSNPCIEILFHAYFGKMPNHPVSQDCIDAFSVDFLRKTKKTYQKNEKEIYRLLYENGDEEKALILADQTTERSRQTAPEIKPSLFCPGTTLGALVGKMAKHRK